MRHGQSKSQLVSLFLSHPWTSAALNCLICFDHQYYSHTSMPEPVEVNKGPTRHRQLMLMYQSHMLEPKIIENVRLESSLVRK